MRKTYSNTEARQLYNEFISSGKLKQIFCKEKKIGATTLYRWEKKFGACPKLKNHPDSKSTTLKEISITNSIANRSNARHEPIQIILLNGIKINIPPNFCKLSLEIILNNLGGIHA